MEFAILGPLRATGAQGPIDLSAPKQRALLAALLLARRDHAVSAERLIDAVWGDVPPATAGKALQVHVSQLRRALGAGQPIVTRPEGYAVRLAPGELDAERFESLRARAREARDAGELHDAARLLREALALFEGAPLAGVKLFGSFAAEADRLAETRLIVLEERVDLDLALGAHAAIAAELEAAAVEHPYREGLHARLALALYRAGRQADALAALRRVRRALLEELGLEPGRELKRLEAAVLAQDPGLDLAAERTPGAPPAAAAAAGTRAARPAPLPPGVGVPAAATPLLGREQELGEADALLRRPGVRLVTLTGPGGIGKTRLAVELAARVAARYPSGVRLAALAAVEEPERVLATVARATGLGEADPRDPVGALAAHLAGHELLLVVDNFEQVLAAAGDLSALLAAAPGVSIVVTSRAALRVAGEHELAIPPLAMDAAVALFAERADAVGGAARSRRSDAHSVERICARLDRLPLAIELAAARSKVLSPGAILGRLEHRLDLLSGGPRDAPARQQTLRAAIGWSLDLLEPPARRLCLQLGVFAGGWTLEAAEAVCGTGTLDALTVLADHSLVTADEGGRFGMLETVREYAVERLEAEGDAAEVRRRHARTLLALAEAAERELSGADQLAWLERLDRDRENLRAAIAFATADGDAETALRLCGALWRFWFVRGHAGESRPLVSAALEVPGGSTGARLKALNAAGVLAGEAGDRAVSREMFGGSLALADAAGDAEAVARASTNLGTLALYAGDFEEAARRYEGSVGYWRGVGDDRGLSLNLQNLALADEGLGRRRHAIELLEDAVGLARDAADPAHLASTLRSLARLLLKADDHPARAVELLRESLRLSQDLGDRPGIVECLESFAAVAGRKGDASTGALLAGAADTTRAASGATQQPNELEWVRAETAALREALGDDGFAATVERGRGLGGAEAVELALGMVT